MNSSRKGFAGMDKALALELASRGGKRAHELGVAHRYTQDEARVNGRKGGLAAAARRRQLKAEEQQRRLTEAGGKLLGQLRQARAGSSGEPSTSLEG